VEAIVFRKEKRDEELLVSYLELPLEISESST
jgi:hypothetical protein